MAGTRSSAFESLESAHEYLELLKQTADDAHAAIQDDIATAMTISGAERRCDALRLVEHKLHRLQHNLNATLVVVNDLRTLRRLLLDEREHRPVRAGAATKAAGRG
jgi:hypothetical protein